MRNIIWFITAALLLINSPVTAQSKKIFNLKEATRIEYKLSHFLHNVEGKSDEGIIQLTVNPAEKTITGVTASVNVASFNSGNSNRDSHAMEVIDAISYPTAAFKSKSISQDGNNIKVTGDLTFHNVKREIVISGRTEWSAKLKVIGTFETTLSAHNIDRPSLMFIPVGDVLEFSFSAEFDIE